MLIKASLLSAAAISLQNPVPDQQQAEQPLTETLIYSEADVKILPVRFPDSFNCFINPSKSSCYLFSLLFESMLTINEVTRELEPNLASHWSISEDGTTIEITINKDAHWDDGLPVTAEDVLFSFRMITHPGSPNFGKKIDYSRFDAEIISERVIRFTTDVVDWRNLPLLGFLHILPAHGFRDVDIMQVQYNFMISSGQYVIETYREGTYLVLKKSDNYWRELEGNTRPDRIIWVFNNEQQNNMYHDCYADSPFYFEPRSYGPSVPFNLDDLTPLEKQQIWEFLDILDSYDWAI